MTSPRIVVPGATTIPLDGRDRVRQIWLYALADAQRRKGVAVYHAIRVVTHHHLSATPARANLPEFLKLFHHDVSCGISTLLAHERYDQPGELFERQAPTPCAWSSCGSHAPWVVAQPRHGTGRIVALLGLRAEELRRRKRRIDSKVRAMKTDIFRSLVEALTVIATVSALAAVAHARPLFETVVFRAGDFGYNHFRVPAIIKAANGDLLAFAEARHNPPRPTDKADTGNIDIIMRRSTNGGFDWEDGYTLVRSNRDNTAGNPVPILDERTGHIHIVFNQNPGEYTQYDIMDGLGNRAVKHRVSTDHGRSWSSSRDITSSAKASNWRWHACGPSGGIQLKRGPHAGRMILAAAFNTGHGTDPEDGGISLLYSDDGGATWQRGAEIVNAPDEDYLPSESQVVELEIGGYLLVNSRNRATIPPLPGHYRGFAYLLDGGQTELFHSTHLSLLDPKVEGATESFTALDEGDAVGRILFSNPFDADERRELTVRTSVTNGLSWDDGKLVYRGPSAYSDMVKISARGTKDPYMGMLYERGIEESFESIVFARFNLSWLEQPGLQQIDFRDYSVGSTLGSGTTILDKEGNGIHGELYGSVSVVGGWSGLSDADHGRNRAIRLDGQNDYILFRDDPGSRSQNHVADFENHQSFTLEAVFKTTAHRNGGANGSGPLFAKDVGPNSPSFWLRIQDGKVRFFIDDGTRTASVTTPDVVADGTWQRIAAVRDAGARQLRLYVNATLVATAVDNTTGDLDNRSNLIIGAFNSSSPGRKRFKGDIHVTRLSMDALAPAERVNTNETAGI